MFKSGLSRSRPKLSVQLTIMLIKALLRSTPNRVGLEQSTNFRWWDFDTRNAFVCRLDLNNPPTAVGGISEFSHTLYRKMVLCADWALLLGLVLLLR